MWALRVRCVPYGVAVGPIGGLLPLCCCGLAVGLVVHLRGAFRRGSARIGEGIPAWAAWVGLAGDGGQLRQHWTGRRWCPALSKPGRSVPWYAWVWWAGCGGHGHGGLAVVRPGAHGLSKWAGQVEQAGHGLGIAGQGRAKAGQWAHIPRIDGQSTPICEI